MIDYFFRWNSVAEAKQDALALQRFLNQSSDSPSVRDWLGDHVLPGVKAWRPSQDTLDNNSPPQVVHNYIAGFMALVSLDYLDDTLLNASALQFALDRDAANHQGDSPRPPIVVKNNIGAIITDIAVSPIFAGSNYPIGGYN